jgi:hypothetical protein
MKTKSSILKSIRDLSKDNIQRLFFCIVTILCAESVIAQAPEIDWQKSYGGSDSDAANSIQQTADGGYIAAGSSSSNDGDVTGNNGDDDFWILKLNTTGNIEWQKSMGGSANDRPYSIQQTEDGGYIVAGSSSSNNGDVSGNHGNTDYWVVKLNTVGEITWQKSLGGSSLDIARSIRQTADGGYIVAGNSRSLDGDVTGNNGEFDYWVVKLNSSGTIEWQKSYGGSSGESAYSIQQTEDGGYIVAGNSNSNNGDVSGNHGDWDYWIVKLNDTGNIQWQKSLGGSFIDVAYSIQQSLEGGYIAVGFTGSNDGDVTGYHEGLDYWIVKLSPTGDLEWQKCLGGSENDTAWSVQQTDDGGYIVAGETESIDGDITGHHGNRDYWAVKLNSIGDILWQKTLGGSGDDIANSILQSEAGGYIAAGRSDSTDGDVTGNHGNSDFWIVKLEPDPLGVDQFNIHFHIHPNPVADILNIEASEPIKSVLVHNLLGQQLMSFNYFDDRLHLDMSELSPNLYFVTVSTDKNGKTFKILVE